MEEKIIWRKRAKKRLQNIYEFLSEHWSERVAENFLDVLETDLELLLIFPQMGIQSEAKPAVRKHLITKHNYLIYTIKNGQLIVLNIKDTRMR